MYDSISLTVNLSAGSFTLDDWNYSVLCYNNGVLANPVWTYPNYTIVNGTSSGTMTPNSLGTSTITVHHPININKLVYITVNVIEPDTGITDDTKYYIMSSTSGRYLSLQSGSDVDGIGIYSVIRNTGNYSKWTVQAQSDSKYQFINNIGSASRVMTASGTNLCIYTDSNASTQKFEIYRINEAGTTQGLYYIKYGSYYLKENSNYNVTLTTSISNATAWSFMAVEKGLAVRYHFEKPMLDLDEDDEQYDEQYDEQIAELVNSIAYMPEFLTLLRSYGYTANGYTYTDFNPTNGKNSLLNADIFVINGHGNAGKMSFNDKKRNYISGIIFANSALIEDDDEIETIQTYYAVDDFESNSLSKARCVLVLGCLTGLNTRRNGVTYNLLDSIYQKGAHFVVGTSNTIIPSSSARYCGAFFTKISEGKSVGTAYTCSLTETQYYCAVTDENNVEREVLLPHFPGVCIGDKFQYLN